MRSHSCSISIAAAKARMANGHSPSQVAKITSGSSTAAETTRSTRLLGPVFAGVSGPSCIVVPCAAGSLTGTAISPLAALEFGNGGSQVLLAEIGPQLVDENQLAVGGLPQQDIDRKSTRLNSSHYCA